MLNNLFIRFFSNALTLHRLLLVFLYSFTFIVLRRIIKVISRDLRFFCALLYIVHFCFPNFGMPSLISLKCILSSEYYLTSLVPRFVAKVMALKTFKIQSKGILISCVPYMISLGVIVRPSITKLSTICISIPKVIAWKKVPRKIIRYLGIRGLLWDVGLLRWSYPLISLRKDF